MSCLEDVIYNGILNLKCRFLTGSGFIETCLNVKLSLATIWQFFCKASEWLCLFACIQQNCAIWHFVIWHKTMTAFQENLITKRCNYAVQVCLIIFPISFKTEFLCSSILCASIHQITTFHFCFTGKLC